MAQCQGPHAQIRLFFGLHLYLAKRYCKNTKVPGAQLNVNPTRAITWFVDVTLYCTFFNNNSPPPHQCLCNKILLKKISYSKWNAHLTNFWIERTWPPGIVCTAITGCFYDKTIISKKNILLDCCLLLKYCRRLYTLLPPAWAKSLTKFNPKMQDFKRILDLNCKQKRGLNKLIGFQMLKI